MAVEPDDTDRALLVVKAWRATLSVSILSVGPDIDGVLYLLYYSDPYNCNKMGKVRLLTRLVFPFGPLIPNARDGRIVPIRCSGKQPKNGLQLLFLRTRARRSSNDSFPPSSVRPDGTQLAKPRDR